MSTDYLLVKIGNLFFCIIEAISMLIFEIR